MERESSGVFDPPTGSLTLVDERGLPRPGGVNLLGLLWVSFATVTGLLAVLAHPTRVTLVVAPLVYACGLLLNFAFLRLARSNPASPASVGAEREPPAPRRAGEAPPWDLLRCLINGPVAFAAILATGGVASPVWTVSVASIMGTARESVRASVAVAGFTILCHLGAYLAAGAGWAAWPSIAARSALLMTLCLFFRIVLRVEQEHRSSCERAVRAVERARAARLEAEACFRIAEQSATHNKMASLGLLAASIAHEINNPINTIINASQIVLDGDAASVGGAERFQMLIIGEGERIARVVSNLLQFARGSSEEYAPTNLRRTIDKTLLLIHHQFAKDGIRVELDLARDLPPVRGRMEELQQVFLNLLTNARYALLEKRRLSPDLVPTIRIEAGADGDDSPSVVCRVRDNGTGIAPELLARIFDPFFTTKPKDEGTGLGLSVCYRIVKEHRGRLEVESRHGADTVFTIRLPAVDGMALENSSGLNWTAVIP
jgi:signal transduction histidine kinase